MTPALDVVSGDLLTTSMRDDNTAIYEQGL
jgi:hypothetical protein